MWKIGGEGAVQYPGIGMSSLARNFAPIVVSYLFAWVSCSRLRFPFFCSFFSLSFLSLPPGHWHVLSSLFLALSLDEIICLLMRDTLSLQRVINSDSTEKQFGTILRMNVSPAISRRDERSGNAFIHRRTSHQTVTSRAITINCIVFRRQCTKSDNARVCKVFAAIGLSGVHTLFSMHADWLEKTDTHAFFA